MAIKGLSKGQYAQEYSAVFGKISVSASKRISIIITDEISEELQSRRQRAPC